MHSNLKQKEKTAAPSNDASGSFVKANLNILNKLVSGIQNLQNNQYTFKPDGEEASIGSHVRHVIEFYQEFIKGVDAKEAHHICYDKRKRNLLLENSLEKALLELQSLKDEISTLITEDMKINLSCTIDPSLPAVTCETTVHRELYSLLEHTTHHMAIIKALSTDFDIVFEKDFGLAHSTKAHQLSEGP